MFLPDIYWCNKIKTERFLSMLVSDLMTQYTLVTEQENSKDKGIEANLGKIIAKYQSQGVGRKEKEGNVVKSTPSLFVDLYTILNEANKIQKLSGFDDDIWKQLEVGEFVEVDGEFKQSPAELLLSSVMDFTEQFKGHFEFAATAEENANLELATKLLNLKKVTMIVNPYIEGDFKFFTSLETEYFLEDRYELEGDFTVMGKIRRIYKPHEKIDLIKLLPGKLRMKKEQLMTFIPNFKNEDISFDVGEINENSFELKGPAIEIMPIAIYQE
ncbi:DUF6414 family protein [Fictibacillus norfolkensis]|uniref:Uncharacterized protein n=1 Tax=Fictibacillus norfolkensis TaxID=2762233 RepID=A0ABR8SPK3_9BACL|nr:hypothetical protein [Fictibacillus norfolkensis]MBD7965382.1 hypothetical protein [Fictibacillus norfolkensis]